MRTFIAMNLLLTKKQIKEELDRVTDERLIWAIAKLLNLETGESADWHKQIVEERMQEYERNPENVISWEDLKKKWQDDI